MELIGYYLLFAFSISIAACYLWFWPLIQEAKAKHIINSFTQYPTLSIVIYILISAVVAPILIMPMFSNSMAENFINGMAKEVLKADPDFLS
jgi:hypothetical protein